MTSDKIQERKDLADRILAESERLDQNHRFPFSCHPGISCFNLCCRDVNIVLTPLDVLSMARRLELTTTEFLALHTLVPFSEQQKLPFVFLKMNESEDKTCPFVTAEGCRIYEDRPWPCRMYPVGEASPQDPRTQGEGFYFLLNEDHCRGHREDREWTIAEWLEDQGVGRYREIGELFKQILLHPYLSIREVDPARMEMFYMASYDLDKFREFVFESRFLNRFALEPGLVEKIRTDDLELLRFAFRWLRFALFGEPSIEVNPDLLSEREREMWKNKKRT